MPKTVAGLSAPSEIYRLSNSELQAQIDAAIALHQMGVLKGHPGEAVKIRASVLAKTLLRRTSGNLS